MVGGIAGDVIAYIRTVDRKDEEKKISYQVPHTKEEKEVNLE